MTRIQPLSTPIIGACLKDPQFILLYIFLYVTLCHYWAHLRKTLIIRQNWKKWLLPFSNVKRVWKISSTDKCLMNVKIEKLWYILSSIVFNNILAYLWTKSPQNYIQTQGLQTGSFWSSCLPNVYINCYFLHIHILKSLYHWNFLHNPWNFFQTPCNFLHSSWYPRLRNPGLNLVSFYISSSDSDKAKIYKLGIII